MRLQENQSTVENPLLCAMCPQDVGKAVSPQVLILHSSKLCLSPYDPSLSLFYHLFILSHYFSFSLFFSFTLNFNNKCQIFQDSFLHDVFYKFQVLPSDIKYELTFCFYFVQISLLVHMFLHSSLSNFMSVALNWETR